MTREKFIEILDSRKYTYEIEGDKIIVKEGNLYGDFDLTLYKSIPPDVEFSNRGHVDLRLLEKIPTGVVFNNEKSVFLDSVESISPGVIFNNGWAVYLNKNLVPGRGEFELWKVNIKGINSKRLLNLMVSRGLFISIYIK